MNTENNSELEKGEKQVDTEIPEEKTQSENEGAKPNLLTKFKSLKKSYQIAVVVALVALIIVGLTNLAPTSTPFDKLTKVPDDAYEVPLYIIEAYGHAEDEDIGPSFNWIRYDYPWLGNQGVLTINLDVRLWGVDIYADWESETENPDKSIKKIKKTMDKAFGDSEYNKQTTIYTWYDKYGNQYQLWANYKYNKVTLTYQEEGWY